MPPWKNKIKTIIPIIERIPLLMKNLFYYRVYDVPIKISPIIIPMKEANMIGLLGNLSEMKIAMNTVNQFHRPMNSIVPNNGLNKQY